MDSRYQEVFKSRNKMHTAEERAKAWTDTAEVVKTYSDEMVQRFNTEIDTYLVYVSRLHCVNVHPQIR